VITDVHVENKPQKRAMVLTVDSLSASVLLSPTKTKITTNDERSRHLLFDIITSHTLSL
jgi:calcineurin-like phosphoesterase